jgi:hypothetical protein
VPRVLNDKHLDDFDIYPISQDSTGHNIFIFMGHFLYSKGTELKFHWKIRGFVENEPSPDVFTSFAPSFDRWSEAGARRPHSYEFAQRMPSLEFSRVETN